MVHSNLNKTRAPMAPLEPAVGTCVVLSHFEHSILSSEWDQNFFFILIWDVWALIIVTVDKSNDYFLDL